MADRNVLKLPISLQTTNDSIECSSNKRLKTTTENEICKETVKQEEYFKIEIGRQCYAVASRFKRQLSIHVRVYGIRDSDLTTYPTKKGITLSLSQWMVLREQCVSRVDQAITDYRNGKGRDFASDLGDNVHVTLQREYPSIHIGTDVQDGMHHSGIALNFDQWDKLKQTMTVVHGLLEREMDNVDTFKDSKNQRDLRNQLQLREAQLDTVVKNPSIMFYATYAMNYSKQDDFGLKLWLSLNDVYCVKADNPYNIRIQCLYLLQMWYGRNGKRATLRRLVEVFDECLKEGHAIDINKLKVGIKKMFT